MEILFMLIPFSVALAFLVVGVFFFSLANGQFEDLEQQSDAVMRDDDAPQREIRMY